MADCGITVLFPIPQSIPYSSARLSESFATILNQSVPADDIVLLDHNNDASVAEELKTLGGEKGLACPIVRQSEGFLENLSLVLDKITTPYFLFLQTEAAPIFLRQSALEQFRWSAMRNPGAGLFYSDYELTSPDGERKEVHLLSFHEGRVRDNMDFGRVSLVRNAALKSAGGISTKYKHGYLYDLRLKIASQAELVLISNRYAGSPYAVEETGKEHNVFDYLLSGKDVQLEMERVFTDHLKRVDAYLPPGEYQTIATYAAEEERKFRDCIATVIIPVNNRPDFIGTAIDSVQQQTTTNVEVIVVVNGGANDPTIDSAKVYLPGGEKYDPNLPPVRLIVHDINNIGLCLNSGLREAKGKYYVQLDSDDRLKPAAIEKLIEVFESDPRIGMVIGSYEVWQKEDDGRFFRREDIPVVTHDEWTEENGRNNLLRINGAGAPRSAHIKVLQEMGWFSVNDISYSRNYGEDYEMVLKISEQYRIGRVWEPIYEVVRHSGGTDHSIDNETVDRNDNAKDMMRLEALRRRKLLNQKV
jgi:glycosyltransferase involved in cell wall biosynthesis